MSVQRLFLDALHNKHSVSPSQSLACNHGRQLSCLCLDISHASNHVKGILRNTIATAREDLLKIVDCGLEINKCARSSCEDLCNEERLRHEALDLPRAGHNELVLLAELIHTQDRDDVLQRLVILEDLLNGSRYIVVALANDGRIQHTRGGVQRVHGWVDTQLGNATRKHSGSIQVCKGGSRRWVGQIIGRHVDCLHGCD
mmetsp:Transcript_125626/g.217513  ORF Transcript_125626/g.217513 Transcript_125626/m.217513 type:complete len:200 (+) Transcript_125626:28-627(+)